MAARFQGSKEEVVFLSSITSALCPASWRLSTNKGAAEHGDNRDNIAQSFSQSPIPNSQFSGDIIIIVTIVYIFLIQGGQAILLPNSD
jgi:hypothetical protein